MIQKRLLCPERLRRVPKQFSWIDQRLVRHRHICSLDYESLSFYLFLVTVSDAEGISYYSDFSICRYLHFSMATLKKARIQLCHGGLLAYSRPLYQVLSLSNSAVLPPALCDENREERIRDDGPVSLSTVFQQLAKDMK